MGSGGDRPTVDIITPRSGVRHVPQSLCSDQRHGIQFKAKTAGVVFNGLHARTDGVDRAIIEQAEESGCGMIVMLSHGRGKLGEFLFGSHTKTMMSGSKLPLLVLH